MHPSEEVQMTPAVELIGHEDRQFQLNGHLQGELFTQHQHTTTCVCYVRMFPSKLCCVVLHVFTGAQGSHPPADQRGLRQIRLQVSSETSASCAVSPCVCLCVTRAYRCTCSGSWRAATTGRVACGTRPRAASCTRCRVTGTWCTPSPSTTPTGNLLQFAVPDTRGRPRSTPPFPPLVLAGTRSPPAPSTRRASCGAQRAGNVSTPSADTRQKLCVQENSTLQQIFIIFKKKFWGGVGNLLFLSLNWQFNKHDFFSRQIVFHQEGKQAKHCGNVRVVRSCANCHVAVNWCFVSFGQKKFFFFPGNFYD